MKFYKDPLPAVDTSNGHGGVLWFYAEMTYTRMLQHDSAAFTLQFTIKLFEHGLHSSKKSSKRSKIFPTESYLPLITDTLALRSPQIFPQ